MPAWRGRFTSSVTPSAVPTRIIGTSRFHSARTAFLGFSRPTLRAQARSARANSASVSLSGMNWVASGIVISAEPNPVKPNISAPANAMTASAVTSPSGMNSVNNPDLRSNLDGGIERIEPAHLGDSQHVPLYRFERVGAAEAALHRTLP